MEFIINFQPKNISKYHSQTLMDQQSQTSVSRQQQISNFISAFNKHYQKTHPDVFKSSNLIKKIEESMLNNSDEQKKQILVKQIQQKLSKGLRNVSKNHKHGVLLIGPPGIGKTAFMKQYAKDNFKILINASCCSLVSIFQHQVTDFIDLLFEMANFSEESILFFDQIDLLMNDENSFQNIQNIRKHLFKNIQNKDYETPIVYSTNKPWKINDKQFLKSIYCAIQIPISSYEKRKALIQMIIKDEASKNYDTSKLDPQDIAQRTVNYLNSDIYVLIRQIMMEPLKQLVQKGKNLEEIQNQDIIKVSQHHIANAYQKIRPSILIQEINEYKEWKQKFQLANI